MARIDFTTLAYTVDDPSPMIERPISSTVGRVLGAPLALIAGTTAPFKPSADRAFVNDIMKKIPNISKDIDQDDDLPLAIHTGDKKGWEDFKHGGGSA